MKLTEESNRKKGEKIIKKRVGLGLAAWSALFFIIFVPHNAFASVDITEIMYDAPGSDSAMNGLSW